MAEDSSSHVGRPAGRFGLRGAALVPAGEVSESRIPTSSRVRGEQQSELSHILCARCGAGVTLSSRAKAATGASLQNAVLLGPLFGHPPLGAGIPDQSYAHRYRPYLTHREQVIKTGLKNSVSSSIIVSAFGMKLDRQILTILHDLTFFSPPVWVPQFLRCQC